MCTVCFALWRRKLDIFKELLATTHEAAKTAINACQAVAKPLGLTVSLPKTKYMVVGYNILQEERQPIKMEGD